MVAMTAAAKKGKRSAAPSGDKPRVKRAKTEEPKNTNQPTKPAIRSRCGMAAHAR
jgi:hypothetical protein